MSKVNKRLQRHQQQRSVHVQPKVEPEPEPEYENPPPSNEVEIIPQINYLRNYTLNTNGLDNISIIFDDQEKKDEFDLSLLNKIWNRKEENMEYYTSHGFKYLYATNKEGEFTNINMLFGITSYQYNNTTTMYLFIFTFSLTTNKGILRAHKVVLPAYTNYALVVNGAESKYGVYSFSGGNQPETPLLGFCKTKFYLPNYSYYLVGKHRNLVEPINPDYEGSFEVNFPTLKN